jgi:CheY-like chemotaxis protein
LHIDDDPMVLQIVASVLSHEPDIETRGYLSGEEGLRAAADWLPDLILSDVSMPGLNGVEVLERLRDNGSTMSIPVVFTTACGRQERINVYMSCGVSGVIPKPFDLRKLGGIVRNYLNIGAESSQPWCPSAADVNARLTDDAASLVELRAAYLSDGDSAPLRQMVHKLAGFAGIFGYTMIGDSAANLERKLEFLSRYPTPSAVVLAGVDELLDLIRRDVARHPD